MAAKRPYINLGIGDLEKLVDSPAGRGKAQAVLAELAYRKTSRAFALQRRLQMSPVQAPPPTAPEAPPTRPIAQPAPTRAPPDPFRPMASPSRPASITDTPAGILASWTVLEVLSPVPYKTPKGLAAGDASRVASFRVGLPWAYGAKGPPGKRLYYQIVLGSIALEPTFEQLLSRSADTRVERPQMRGDTPVAVVIVDRDGRPVPDRCAVVSSFAWGLPIALAEDLARLADWPANEERLQRALHDRLHRVGADGRAAVLDASAIDDAAHWLADELGLSDQSVKPPTFAIRSFVPFKSNDPPAALLLNSFYLHDLARATSLVSNGKAPDTLMRFLGAIRPPERRDLLHDEGAIEDALAPAAFPAGRWPGPGRRPLVLMQQAAVNLAMQQSAGELLAVNGPPGTGKTTLLRDVVAALVTERASAMASFDDPEAAFAPSGQKLKRGDAWIHLYKLDDHIKGFEMLIASSNNKAVENVSGELPARSAIASDATSMRYFKPLSDGMANRDSWGAIAAVLGNASNRYAFKQSFWWDPDTGLFSYLKAVDGRSPEVEDASGRKRTPRIVAELAPPTDRRTALRRWRAAVDTFRVIERRVSDTRASRERLRRLCRHLPALDRAWHAAQAHAEDRPGVLTQILRLAPFRRWRAAHEPLSDALAAAAAAAAADELLPRAVHRILARSPWFDLRPKVRVATVELAFETLRAEFEQLRRNGVAQRIDEEFFEGDRRTTQMCAPWIGANEHRDRDALFEAALDLHRAFIDAAAKPLRHNLGAALDVLDGRGFGDPAKDALIPDLWSTLFLVVPAVSTTFASVATMLGPMPPGSIGWLLIDEAGQAAPQQAVGAIMRAGRAIVVGDPIQVPPVVALPERLTQAICQSFGVAADVFGAPAASVQTLADSATPWFADFPSGSGSRTVGVPLLVHRRCAEPMFGIANRIAYENLMVQAKRAAPSPIGDLLGPSRWIDITGPAEDRWSETEGRAAVDVIERIVAAGLVPDLYVVTPFVQVADGLRQLINASPLLAARIPELRNWTAERVGTVHTVQGREAEAVLLVLGAPRPDQTGARAWAGGRPNLLNVAVTRAKERVYVFGNRAMWRSAGVFGDLARTLP